MSVFKDKKIIGKYNKNWNGILIAANISAIEILIWVIVLLPSVISMKGAGVCFVDIGLFAGTTYVWLFLVKRLRSYDDISGKNMLNIQDFIYARYSSNILKNMLTLVWFVIIGAIACVLIMFMADMICYFIPTDRNIINICIIIFFIICICLLDRKVIATVKSIIYFVTVIVCIALIVALFIYNSPSELLDIYRNARISGGTSVYLNILYMDGKPLAEIDMINMLAMSLGCMGLPFLYKGAFLARDIRELDRGRIMSIVYTGIIVVVFSMWSLLIITCIYPSCVETGTGTYELVNTFVLSLYGDMSYGKTVSTIITIILGGSVLCLTGSMFSTMIEIIRAYVPDRKLKLTSTFVMALDLVAIILVAGIIYFLCGICEWRYDVIMKKVWEICGGLAAPVILSVLWEKASKTGITIGIITSVTISCIWMWAPVYQKQTLESITGIEASIISFVASLLLSVIFSIIFRNKNKEEIEIFRKMRLDQR